jgi:putative ubiquitin-RnfH superfamily antitoxin RatB of RatAB toxin-antitoxin module
VAKNEPAAASGTIRVEIVRAWPRRFESVTLELPAGTVVGEALAQAGFRPVAPSSATVSSGQHATEVQLSSGGPVGEDALAAAIYGERVSLDHVLHSGDRIEWLRPLLADPKDTRRRRAKRS